MPKLSVEQLAEVNRYTDEAFSNRKAVKSESGETRSLFVDVPDEDGYAGWLENLHFLGLVQTPESLVVATDFPRKAQRMQEIFRFDRTTGQLNVEIYRDGQAAIFELDPDMLIPRFRRLLQEAKNGAPFRKLMSSEVPSFLAPELRSQIIDLN
jgi:hypothetical protein